MFPVKEKIWLDGKEITALDEDGRAALRADSVGFVFQSFHLISSLTALENVMLPLELAASTMPQKPRCRPFAQSVWSRARAITLTSFPAVKSSASRLPGLSLFSRRYCLPMSQPETWISGPATRSSTCCSK